MRLLVCGGRDFSDRDTLWATLDALHAERPIEAIIHGAARGADTLAHEWAVSRSVTTCPFLADWGLHRRAAGPRRNAQMLREGRPDAVLAFPGGKGTADMVARAKVAGVPILGSSSDSTPPPLLFPV